MRSRPRLADTLFDREVSIRIQRADANFISALPIDGRGAWRWSLMASCVPYGFGLRRLSMRPFGLILLPVPTLLRWYRYFDTQLTWLELRRQPFDVKACAGIF